MKITHFSKLRASVIATLPVLRISMSSAASVCDTALLLCDARKREGNCLDGAIVEGKSKSLRFKLNELLTVEELASKLRVSLKTVRSWVYLRRIPFTRFMRRVYFPLDVVEMLL